MILLDANVLLYAYDAGSPRHAAAKGWLEEQLSGRASVLLPWHTVLAFLRIVTNRRAVFEPMTIEEAVGHVESWLARSCVHVVGPTPAHWSILEPLLVDSQAPSSLVPDAHLAALAIEHGAELQSTDRDFARFDGLRWTNPLTD